MKPIEITLKPTYWLILEREDLEPLFILSEGHYDGHCRSISRKGGFLYQWRAMTCAYRDAGIEAPKCEASSRDLDTLLKVCEPLRAMQQLHHISPAQAKRINALCELIMAALSVGAVEAMKDPISVAEASDAIKLRWATAPGRY